MENIDLKHMRIFLRLVREKSASRVAFDAGMSQQAISGYLKRLREVLPHEIFLRHSSGLEPTDFALEVARKFERILADVGGVFQAQAFDPSTLDRRIGIIANEYAQLSMLPKFVARLRGVAPKLRVKVLDFDRAAHAEQLASGYAEIAVGFSALVDASLMRTSLVDEQYCCVVGERSAIPGQVRSVGDVGKFARVDFAESDSYSGDGVARFLSANDALHPPVATLACYTSLKPFLDFNDVVAFVPSAVAIACQLTQIDLGVKPDAFTAAVAWHRRSTGSPLGNWLRGVLVECVGG